MDAARSRYSSGILTWIRQWAAGRPTGVAASMLPWTIKVTIQRRVLHQEGKGHSPMLAEVQGYCQPTVAVQSIGQILTLAVTFVIA